jgi:hypothetical protein
MCGGLIHPIAGKCKHCKGDLAGLRNARPAAAAALPSIIATNGTHLNPPTNGHGHANGHNGHANGHANGRNGQASYAPIPMAAQHVAMPMQLARQYEENPILPPRPTGRMQTTVPRASWWKSWPLIVIVLAVLAIVTAVVLMVWPPGKSAAADNGEMKGGKAMPAPERMETNPLPPKDQPPAKSGDPWNDNKPGARIDIPDDPDDDLAGRGGPSGGLGLGGGPKPTLRGTDAMAMEVTQALCDRAAICSNDATLKALCTQTRQSLQMFDLQPPTCAARPRCLAHIKALDCDMAFDMSALATLTSKIQDCVEATTTCS